VLFVGEAVTLAHVARPVVLAAALDPALYAVTVAFDRRFDRLFGELPGERREIWSIPTRQFLDAVHRGRPLFDLETLRAYVRQDLQLIEESRPELVVGDFRLSLAVSARVAGVPYATITNAYWSPYARQRFPLPELAINRYLGLTLAHAAFRLLRPLAFALHTVPLNRLCREYGRPLVGADLRRIHTAADFVLYSDVPALAPTRNLPASHVYLGPVRWSPATELPAWWTELPSDRPLVYVTLGSSGQRDVLPIVLGGLSDMAVTVIAATAGSVPPSPVPANAYVNDYLPGDQAAARADLVISNGGSPTTYQALAAGKPVLGIATNLDQFLNMEAIQRAGVGAVLRAGRLTAPSVRRTVDQLLGDPVTQQAARGLGQQILQFDAAARFRDWIAQREGQAPPPARNG
jgi:UDP:flavonoid glycosyltransferase YjiC (YdhE family)